MSPRRKVVIEVAQVQCAHREVSGWRNQDGCLEEAALTMDLGRVEDTPLAEKGRPGEGHSIGKGREVGK